MVRTGENQAFQESDNALPFSDLEGTYRAIFIANNGFGDRRRSQRILKGKLAA
jgi:hypothetical protein